MRVGGGLDVGTAWSYVTTSSLITSPTSAGIRMNGALSYSKRSPFSSFQDLRTRARDVVVVVVVTRLKGFVHVGILGTRWYLPFCEK
jgi:hypothetical protein